MPHEALIEAAGGLVEMGLEVASETDGKGCRKPGCWIAIILMVVAGIIIYYNVK